MDEDLRTRLERAFISNVAREILARVPLTAEFEDDGFRAITATVDAYLLAMDPELLLQTPSELDNELTNLERAIQCIHMELHTVQTSGILNRLTVAVSDQLNVPPTAAWRQITGAGETLAALARASAFLAVGRMRKRAQGKRELRRGRPGSRAIPTFLREVDRRFEELVAANVPRPSKWAWLEQFNNVLPRDLKLSASSDALEMRQRRARSSPRQKSRGHKSS